MVLPFFVKYISVVLVVLVVFVVSIHNKTMKQGTVVIVLTLNRTLYFHIIDSAHIITLSDSILMNDTIFVEHFKLQFLQFAILSKQTVLVFPLFVSHSIMSIGIHRFLNIAFFYRKKHKSQCGVLKYQSCLHYQDFISSCFLGTHIKLL